MEIGADISHGAHSAVPSGLRQSQISVPNVETLGYSRLSLRDKGLPWSGAYFMGSNPSGIGHSCPQQVSRVTLLKLRRVRTSLRTGMSARRHGGIAEIRPRDAQTSRHKLVACHIFGAEYTNGSNESINPRWHTVHRQAHCGVLADSWAQAAGLTLTAPEATTIRDMQASILPSNLSSALSPKCERELVRIARRAAPNLLPAPSAGLPARDEPTTGA